MSKNINKKTTLIAEPKKKILKESNSDSEVDSDSESFNQLNISINDLKKLDVVTKDCSNHYFNIKDKCVYSQNLRTNKWTKAKDTVQKKLIEMSKCDIDTATDKKSKKKKVVESNNDLEIENTESKQIEEKNVTNKEPKKRLSKNEIYLEDQERTFNELKALINVKKNNTFTSEDVRQHNDEIMTNIFRKLKKYYDAILSKGINTTEIKASVAIIRKIFKHHGFELATKEYKQGDIRGVIYVMIESIDDNTNKELIN